MGNQEIKNKNPLFIRIKTDESANYVFSFTLKYYYLISTIFIFLSIFDVFKPLKFASALITLLLTIIFHIYKSRLIAGIFIFFSSANFLLMALKSTDPIDLIFQLVIVALCVRSWQAASFIENNKIISNDQTA